MGQLLATLSFISLVLLIVAPSASAQVPDFRGTYIGSGTSTQSGCSFPPNNGTLGYTLVVQVTSETSQGTFVATGSATFPPGPLGQITNQMSFSGTVTSGGALSGSESGTVFLNGVSAGRYVGTFTGLVSGNLLTVNYSAHMVVGETCSIVGSAFADRQTSVLAAAVLPSSRSVMVGGVATAFASIVNGGTTAALGCSIAPLTGVPSGFTYQTTDPATNQVVGASNTPADIPAGGVQTFVFAFAPSSPFPPTDVQLSFACANAPAAPIQSGLDTLLLSASSTPVPDIVALAATLDSDGIVNIPGATGTGVLAVATVNVGADGQITVTADTSAAKLPVSLSLCQTSPMTGVCLGTPAGSVTTSINTNTTPTFGIFVTGTGGVVPFDPANNRVFVRFSDSSGVVRGATSVAARTQ